MSGELSLRVRVQDVWDDVRLSAASSSSLGALKRRALDVTRVVSDPDGYVVKFRGAEIADGTTLAEAGVVANANLIVLPRRRRPVR